MTGLQRIRSAENPWQYLAQKSRDLNVAQDFGVSHAPLRAA
jgi:hypothetical protein